MGLSDDIIKDLKNIKWEEKAKTEIDAEMVTVASAKIVVPYLADTLKKLLADQMVEASALRELLSKKW